MTQKQLINTSASNQYNIICNSINPLNKMHVVKEVIATLF